MAIKNPKVRSRIEFIVYDDPHIPHSVRIFGEPIGVGTLERLHTMSIRENHRYRVNATKEDVLKVKEEQRKELLTKEEEEDSND